MQNENVDGWGSKQGLPISSKDALAAALPCWQWRKYPLQRITVEGATPANLSLISPPFSRGIDRSVDISDRQGGQLTRVANVGKKMRFINHNKLYIVILMIY